MDAGAWFEKSFMRTVKTSLICPTLLLWSFTTTLVHHFSWIVIDRGNGFQFPLSITITKISNKIGRNTRSNCHMHWPYIGSKGRNWIVVIVNLGKRERELLDWLLSCYQEFDTFDIWLSYHARTTDCTRSENQRVCRDERWKSWGWPSWPRVLSMRQLVLLYKTT